jgi:hypothetical protein
VPFYQIAVDLLIATALLQLVIYSPFILRRALPIWAKVGFVAVSLVLFGGVVHAVLVGTWPFRG